MQLNGQNLNGDHPLDAHGGVRVRTFEAKVPLIPQRVLAAMATDFGSLEEGVSTPGGHTRQPFSPGDYIVSDIPPTHAWVVKGNVFEASYDEA